VATETANELLALSAQAGVLPAAIAATSAATNRWSLRIAIYSVPFRSIAAPAGQFLAYCRPRQESRRNHPGRRLYNEKLNNPQT
jgi:hypothetical protein